MMPPFMSALMQAQGQPRQGMPQGQMPMMGQMMGQSQQPDMNQMFAKLLEQAAQGDYNAGTELLKYLSQGQPAALEAITNSNPTLLHFLFESMKPKLPPMMGGMPPMPPGGPQ